MRSYLARVRLVATDEAPTELDRLRRELPTIAVEQTDTCGVCDAIVDAEEWRAATDLTPFDVRVARSPSDAVSIRAAGSALELTACQVLGRYQRYIDRRNTFSSSRVFDAVLRGHCGIFDCDAEGREGSGAPFSGDAHTGWDRAVDRWQWLLRLAPDASFALQAAALFWDVPSYIEEVLGAADVAPAIRQRTTRLVFDGDRRLDDAEALSYLSLTPRPSRERVTSLAARLGRAAREKLPLVHLRPDVRHWLVEAIAA